MGPDLETRRRAVLIIYKRYLRAERDWQMAQEDVSSWFPAPQPSKAPPIGEPGSRVRRLHDRRDRAVAQLMLAQRQLHELKRRAPGAMLVLALPRR